MGKALDLTHSKVGLLTVIRAVKNNNNKNKLWECVCECGNTKILTASELNPSRNTRTTKSCGCLKRQIRPSKHKGIFTLPKGDAGLYNFFVKLENRAKYKNIEMSLTLEDVRILTKNNCFFCNKIPSQKIQVGRTLEAKEHSTFIYNGIDRLNSKLGYTKQNCVPCCGQCNNAKNIHSLENFIEWIRKCYINLQDKKYLL